MFESVLVDQNPHWDGAVYPEGVPRQVLDDIKKHLDLPHILSCIGVRRAGAASTGSGQALRRSSKYPSIC
jgi:hypothetical protein